MPTNIDTGLTVQDAIAADHSPHIFTMSNGDLVVIYYNGTNLVWRSKSGGSWSAATTITLDTGVTPPKISYLTRNGDVIFANVSTDPIDASHNADWFRFTYNTATHVLGQTTKQVDAGDGNEKAAGIGYISGATANNQVQMLHGNAAGNFATIQQLNVNPTIVGTDVATVFGDFRQTARTGLITDGASTTYLLYAIAATGTAFKIERIVTTGTTSTAETPPAPAALLAGVTGIWDGTNFVIIANENNAKLRYLTRTGTNTYGAWTDILSDASLVGEPAVCVKSNGDLMLFYRTNKNQANGEIWVVSRVSGTWGSPSLLAGGASTGWSNPSCAASDLNDAGNARVVYVTGTASTWTLVEDNATWSSGGVAIVGEADGVGAATFALTVTHNLVGEADGVGAATLSLTVSHTLTGEADGVGTATLTPTVSHLIAGTAAGTSGASLNLTTPIRGETDGVSSATLTLTVTHQLTGEADGAGNAALALTVTHNLAMRADGTGVATLGIIAGGVSAKADGVGTTTLTLTVTHVIAGEADGAGTSTLTLTVSHQIAVRADGSGVATLALLVGGIKGEADGVGVVTLSLATAVDVGTVGITDTLITSVSLIDQILGSVTLGDAVVEPVTIKDIG